MPNLKNFCLLLCTAFIFISCQESEEVAPSDSSLYFPPISGDTWETVSPAELGWNTDEVDNLLTFAEDKNSRALIVLKDGRIAIEAYFGKKFNGIDNFDKDALWYWASAGKTLRATLVGIAQEEGYLSIDDATSQYLGEGWTSLSKADEDKITIKHQLSMSSGLDDFVPDKDCTDPECLELKAAPNQRWAYHNAPYTLLEDVIASATNQSFQSYITEKISKPTGISGIFSKNGFNNVFYSTPRSMARFGLLMLNEGTWDDTPVLKDKTYFQDMVNTSQSLNEAYGYLWWLNGKSSYMTPVLRQVFNGKMTPNAPDDMYAALGKSGQIISIVPSQNLVIIRMGDEPNADRAVSLELTNSLWGELNKVIN